jgi:isopentenyl-diphosphate delta-isomerase
MLAVILLLLLLFCSQPSALHTPRLSRRATLPLSAAEAPWGAGLSQDDLMVKDECIVVDADDVITGHASKRDTHIFSPAQPHGVLHRAFSVFLFNNEGKLLLQQRAASKITFPDVWTNTCCSHPLYGYSPNEVDDEAAVASGAVPGIKAAAVRKLQHELGIDCRGSGVDIDTFRYLGRIHYCAADDDTGPASGGVAWGEHEIDYMLFLRWPGGTAAGADGGPRLALNPEEVQATRYVSLDELRDMMADPSLKWCVTLVV